MNDTMDMTQPTEQPANLPVAVTAQQPSAAQPAIKIFPPGTKFTINPHAEALSAMSPEAFVAFSEDVRIKGILDPVVVDTNGVVIAGRHRYIAAIEHHKPIPAIVVAPLDDAGVASQIISRDILRRHMSPAEHAAQYGALKLLQTVPENLPTQEVIVKTTGVSVRTLRKGSRVAEISPIIHKATVEKLIKSDPAMLLVKLPDAERKQAEDAITRGDTETALAMAKAARKSKQGKVVEGARETPRTALANTPVHDRQSRAHSTDKITWELSAFFQHLDGLNQEAPDVTAESVAQVPKEIRRKTAEDLKKLSTAIARVCPFFEDEA